jgi:3-carboxy-cis,cis-muconate cycloisomerase
MKPSSSTSDGLFDALFGDRVVDEAVNDRALIQAMLRVEGALAQACADVGLVPTVAAETVAATCATLDVDAGVIGDASTATGNPVVPLLDAIRSALPPEVRDAVHVGATSQDIVDTALMLVTRAATQQVRGRVDDAADRCGALAEEHRETVTVARTLGKQAMPTTFGRTAAGWMAQLDAASDRLVRLQAHGFAVQLGGPVGTLAAYGERGPDVVTALAHRLELPAPLMPWHTDRQRVIAIAMAFAGVAAATGKVASDVLSLAADEVGEVDAGDGASSSMPHKRNPVGAVLVRAASIRAPGLVSTLLSAAVHEHERATGAWHAEWVPWLDLVRIAGGAADRLVVVLEALSVNTERMRANAEAAAAATAADVTTWLEASAAMVDVAVHAHGTRRR